MKKRTSFLALCSHALLVLIVGLFSACPLIGTTPPETKPEAEFFINGGIIFPTGVEQTWVMGASEEVSDVVVPETFDLQTDSPYFGPVRDQQSQSSCGAQTLAQFMTFSENKLLGMKNPTTASSIYSANYIYNQLVKGVNTGIVMRTAMDLLKEQGDATIAAMPDSTTSQSAQPTEAAKKEAARHKLESYRFISSLGDIKAAVASGTPVVIGIACPSGLSRLDSRNDIYRSVPPLMSEEWVASLGGHALLVVGYDTESFVVMNSWGTTWGRKGFGRIGYPAMKELLREAYVLDNTESDLPKDPVDWRETFDSDAVRTEWTGGTNHSSYVAFENFIVSSGALRQTQKVTTYRNPSTGIWTDGYVELVKSTPVTTKLLESASVVTVKGRVTFGERDSWYKRVGVVSLGFNFRTPKPEAAALKGSMWIQNAFGSTSAQLDARKVMGLYWDGRGISPWNGPKPYDGFSSLLTAEEVSKMQPGKTMEFRFEINLAENTIRGGLKGEGDRDYTTVGVWTFSDLREIVGDRLQIQPLVGCTGTVCSFDDLSVESR